MSTVSNSSQPTWMRGLRIRCPWRWWRWWPCITYSSTPRGSSSWTCRRSKIGSCGNRLHKFTCPDCLEAMTCSVRIRIEKDPQIIVSGCYGGWSTFATKLPNQWAFGRRAISYQHVIVPTNCILFKLKWLKRKNNFITSLYFYYPGTHFVLRIIERIVWCLYTSTCPFFKSTTIA